MAILAPGSDTRAPRRCPPPLPGSVRGTTRPKVILGRLSDASYHFLARLEALIGKGLTASVCLPNAIAQLLDVHIADGARKLARVPARDDDLRAFASFADTMKLDSIAAATGSIPILALPSYLDLGFRAAGVFGVAGRNRRWRTRDRQKHKHAGDLRQAAPNYGRHAARDTSPAPTDQLVAARPVSQ